MSSQSATSASIASITAPPQYLRGLGQFENRKELLYAFYDAIGQNKREWMASGVVHGNINLDTIRIGNMYGPPGTRGILIDNKHSPSPIHAFKSIMTICMDATTAARMPPWTTLDYVDDLESFYYVLAYICTTFSGPHTRLHASAIPSQTKLMWSLDKHGSLSSRCSERAFQEKETNLRSFRYGKPGGVCLTPYFSGDRIMETLLKDLHCVLRHRFVRKTEDQEVDARPSEELLARMREEAKDDYLWFKQCIEYAIGRLEGNV